MTVLRSAVVGVILFVAAWGVSSEAQQMPGMPSPPAQLNPVAPPSTRARPNLEAPDALPDFAARQMEIQNMERHNRMMADTDKLLALASDLKAQVDKTNKATTDTDAPTMDSIKKADEIEKLAKSVKDRMKS